MLNINASESIKFESRNYCNLAPLFCAGAFATLIELDCRFIAGSLCGGVVARPQCNLMDAATERRNEV